MKVTRLLLLLILLSSPLFGAEEVDGWCSFWQNFCHEGNCGSTYWACRNQTGESIPDICVDQYNWCMEGCMGDFWCGFLQY